jgi:DNA recombination protein RmuC
MDLLAVGIAAFVVGGLGGGAFAWLLATMRTRAAMQAPLRESETRAAAAAARADALAASLEDQRELLDAAKAHLGDAFQTMAAEALRTSQEDFLTLASERLAAVRTETTMDVDARQQAQQLALEGMVAPVRASLEKVDAQIRTMERERGTAYGELRQQLAGLAATHDKLRDATGNLVSALKAPAVRGRWGEMQLRRVVELCGMLEHCDFDEQVTAARVDDDGRMRPDLVVRLPNGRNIVVDAKVPLGAYLEAREAPDEETRGAKLRQHAAQVRTHVAKLAAKSYWEGFAVAPEVVVMFLPGESLYAHALEQMPDLIEDGFARGVLVATPTTLLGLLRAIGSGWREERIAENAKRISDEGRRLHERIATVLEHMADLGNALNQSVKHYNRSLKSFEGRVVVSARRLEEMDAKGKKELPELADIEVRATPPLPDSRVAPPQVPSPREAGRGLGRGVSASQQPLLKLAPPASANNQE